MCFSYRKTPFFSEFLGGDVMYLVYGSSSSSYMDCEVHCVLECYDSPNWDSFQTVLLRRRLR